MKREDRQFYSILRHNQEQYQFPWREGNDFRLLIDAQHFFPAMLGAINSAQNFVFLEMYLFESGTVADKFIDAFIQAARRGLEVCLLLDDFGARNLSQQDRSRIKAAGINTIYYNPLRFTNLHRNLLRDHRKLLLVDGRHAFVGGAGITDVFDPPLNGGSRWRETMIEAAGPNVTDWLDLFIESWLQSGGPAIDVMPPLQDRLESGKRGRVTCTLGLRHTEIKRSAINRIRGSSQHVWLATAYFVPSRKMRRVLRAAAIRGVDVRLLLPGSHTDHPAIRHAGRRFYYRLLRDGVRIFEYQPRFSHSKLLLVDNWFTIGSSNFDRWSLRWNLEANQEIEDPLLAGEVRDMLEHDFAESTEYTFKLWSQRPWYRRLPELFWGRIDWLLERLNNLFQPKSRHPPQK